jgi:hypothetical protein
MSGFREFMPGQVWFYFNGQATKDLEKRKELGSCTSRPVVIIQGAFYPEWNDIVTVCPLTSSDRRSGVYIDSTILKDGSIIEGGTVLPYLIYNIKTKFLFPVIATNHKRKLISLSPEDFQRVRQGYLYHLGENVEEPDYVHQWKHLSDFDRNIVIHDVRLAISDMEDMAHDGKSHNGAPKKISNNPLLVQAAPQTNHVENHLNASFTEYDRYNQTIHSADEPFNQAHVGDVEHPVTEKTVQHAITIPFMEMKPNEFATSLSIATDGIFPTAGNSQIFPNSQVLNGIELKNMPNLLSKADQIKLASMTMAEIMQNTGIGSGSTASRLRRQLRDNLSSEGFIAVSDNTVTCLQITGADPFRYSADLPIVKSRIKRTAKRRKDLFHYDQPTQLHFIGLSLSDMAAELQCSPSYARLLKLDIASMYPHQKVQYRGELRTLDDIRGELENEATFTSERDDRKLYAMWETLSPTEIHEIRSCNKKNIAAMARNFDLSKEKAKQLKAKLMTNPGGWALTEEHKKVSCIKVIKGDYRELSAMDLLHFCCTDHADICQYYSDIKSANTPSKAEIRSLKNKIRRLIVKSIE